MLWHSELKSVANGIDGFNAAVSSLLQFWAHVEVDQAGHCNNDFPPLAEKIVDRVRRILEGETLPAELRKVLERFVARWDGISSKSGWKWLQTMTTLLSILRSDVEFFLNDRRSLLSSLVHRALLHLQRLIVADENVKNTWSDAFGRGETSVERLGGAHFLHHGIYAFKVDAERERTDLVLGGKLAITPEIHAAAEGLVLTEWKMVRKPSEIETQARTGKDQAMLYSMGSLAGFELTSERFVILVSRERLPARDPETIDSVTYTYANIAVDLMTPSKESKAHT
ncbi:MAG: hypothetical protein DHS20C21_01930 [Gemmatimonadota bacterium]|nr:MAG: hypothetical protein DHS20C21_01930 [Gemmatimonadota bacterium]